MASAVIPRQRSGIITLLTDFGTTDAFVGVMKGVILGINRRAQLVDLTHEVPAHDVEAAAFVLATAYRFFPTGTVHVVVVDPGVGSERRAIAVAAGGQLFVAPDNGVLSYVFLHEPTFMAWAIARREFCLSEVSATFHGRDVFAPVAAHLSLGVAPDELGPSVTAVVRAKVPEPILAEKSARGQVVYFDRFGNAITNLPRNLMGSAPSSGEMTVCVGRHEIRGLVECYEQGEAGSPIALWGSCGYLEIAVPRGSARELLGLVKGQEVVVQW